MKLNQQTVDCPECGGNPEMDSEGRYYTCFFCCDTGGVSAEVAQAHEREQVDFAERFAPRRMGIFFRPMTDEYDFDETAPQAGSRLFTRLLPYQRVQRAPVFVDDIPF